MEQSKTRKIGGFSLTFTPESILKFPHIAMAIRTLILVPQTKTRISFLSLLLSSMLDGETLSLKGEKIMTILILTGNEQIESVSKG